MHYSVYAVCSMRSISLVLLLIVGVDLSRSNKVVSQIDGLCGNCENIDLAKYDSDELRTEFERTRYRVWNGTIVRPSELRWVASVYSRVCANETERPCKSPKDFDYRVRCSGALVSSRFVLTAGHVCKLNLRSLAVSSNSLPSQSNDLDN